MAGVKARSLLRFILFYFIYTNGCGADAKRDRQVVGAVKEVTQRGVRFADGKEEQFDAIIQATGYRSNVPSWLKVKTQPTSFLWPRCSAPCRHPAPLPFSCMPGPGLAGAASSFRREVSLAHREQQSAGGCLGARRAGVP